MSIPFSTVGVHMICKLLRMCEELRRHILINNWVDVAKSKSTPCSGLPSPATSWQTWCRAVSIEDLVASCAGREYMRTHSFAALFTAL
ncbi:hypothetical protein MTO96_013796 [Rhipicephalus appendiculatus]